MAEAIRERSLTVVEDRPVQDRHVGATVLVAVVHASLAAPAIYNAVFAPERWTGPQDFPAHTVAAEVAFSTWHEPVVPHFLTHLSVKIVTFVLGTVDLRVGMFIVSVVSCGLFGAVLFRYLHHALDRHQHAAVVAAASSVLVAFGEAPTIVLGWSYQWPPDFFLPLNMPHTPTSMVVRPLSLLLFLVTVACLVDPSTKYRRWLAPFAVLTLLAKPNLVPSLGFVAIVMGLTGRNRPNGRRRLWVLTTRLVLPFVSVAVLQWVIMRTQSPEEFGNRGIVIAPFRDLATMGAANPLFWTAFLFPVIALVLFRQRLLSFEVRVAAWCTIVSLIAAVMFGLDGGIPFSGDFLHFLQAALLILVVTVTFQLLRLWAESDGEPGDGARGLTLALVALPYVVGGLSHWSCQGGGPCLVA